MCIEARFLGALSSTSSLYHLCCMQLMPKHLKGCNNNDPWFALVRQSFEMNNMRAIV